MFKKLICENCKCEKEKFFCEYSKCNKEIKKGDDIICYTYSAYNDHYCSQKCLNNEIKESSKKVKLKYVD